MRPDALDLLDHYAEVTKRANALGVRWAKSSIVPDSLRDRPKDVAAVIIFGFELGLSPVQSVREVYPGPKGRLEITARTMVALAKRHGCQIQTVETTRTHATLAGVAPDGTKETVTYSIEDAQQAGYVAVWDEVLDDWVRTFQGTIKGNPKYVTDPKSMLYAKAAAILCRHLVPEVLLGIDLVEERESPGPGNPAEKSQGPEVMTAEQLLVALERKDVTVPVPDPDEVSDDDLIIAPPELDAEADAAAADPDGPSTREQVRAVTTLLTTAGHTTPTKKRAHLTSLLDRPVTGVKDLTHAEAVSLIASLGQPPAEISGEAGAAPDPPPHAPPDTEEEPDSATVTIHAALTAIEETQPLWPAPISVGHASPDDLSATPTASCTT